MPSGDNSSVLRLRLVREFAQRICWSGLAYAVFAGLFSVNLEGWGRVTGLSWCGLLVVSGAARTLTARRVIAGGHDAEFDGNLLIRIAAAQSVIFGAFVAYALWSVRGQVIPECLLVIGVAGFSSVGATLFAPISGSVQLNVWVQLAPMYVWSAYALPRYGWLLLALFVVHAVVILKVMRLNTSHIREVFLAQLTLEAQTDDLRQARDDADRAGSAKMRFLANMSHEIRTPLNGILGLAEVMNGLALTPEQREVLEDIDRSGHHLLSIVNDILDMAKVSSGKLSLEQAPFDLPRVIRDMASPATALAEAQQLRFLLEMPPELPRQVRGDPVRIRQVVSNLLSNAVKFTPSGEVRLAVEVPGPGWIRFRVSDTGIGLSPEQKDSLFQEFHQVDASSTRRFGGSGR